LKPVFQKDTGFFMANTIDREVKTFSGKSKENICINK
jgi:hypothetical protein